MKEIENRQDVNLLVNAFYDQIRTDELLGPIFNRHIKDEQWPPHLEKLTDFWMMALFGVMEFKGNPTGAHRKVDMNLNHTIEKGHFDHWIGIWHKTIDSLFTGFVADKAKNASENMAIGQFRAILHFRSEFNE